ncbi:MAG: hypothetical protein LBJ12_01560 [Oscillospiraceae bacterium]|nr:hypothetical protein [Oscillospiraceae bacterium]
MKEFTRINEKRLQKNKSKKSLLQKLRLSAYPLAATGQYFRVPAVLLSYLVWMVIFIVNLRYYYDFRAGRMALPSSWTGVALLSLGVLHVILFMVVLMLTKQNWVLAMDCCAVQGFAMMSGGKFGCVLAGCCFSVIHDQMVKTQAIEGACYTLVTLLTVLFMAKSKHYRIGRACSVNTFGYAFFRFLWGFLRVDDGSPALHLKFLGMNPAQGVTLVLMGMAVLWWFMVPNLNRWQKALLERWEAWLLARKKKKI